MRATSAGERIVPPFGPLEGIRVIDSGRFVAGPWGGTYLGEFGAEVIHVEGLPFEPPFADPTRSLTPLVPSGESPPSAVSESWVQYSRNKLSLGLDLRSPTGREVFLDLVRRSDIWIESSRPGTYARLRLSDPVVRAANPKITIVHVSGYGQTGEPSPSGRAVVRPHGPGVQRLPVAPGGARPGAPDALGHRIERHRDRARRRRRRDDGLCPRRADGGRPVHRRRPVPRSSSHSSRTWRSTTSFGGSSGAATERLTRACIHTTSTGAVMDGWYSPRPPTMPGSRSGRSSASPIPAPRLRAGTPPTARRSTARSPRSWKRRRAWKPRRSDGRRTSRSRGSTTSRGSPATPTTVPVRCSSSGTIPSPAGSRARGSHRSSRRRPAGSGGGLPGSARTTTRSSNASSATARSGSGRSNARASSAAARFPGGRRRCLRRSSVAEGL